MLCTLSTWESSMCITAGGPWTGPMVCIACLALSSRVIVQPLGLGGLTTGAFTGCMGTLRLLHLRLESTLGFGTCRGGGFLPAGPPLLPCLGGGRGLSALACTLMMGCLDAWYTLVFLQAGSGQSPSKSLQHVGVSFV